ncbi:MAG: hypothetical protein IKI31_05865 [Treponema sp.]|nr:hypothetical protein [Treponema sp.]
MQSLFFSESIPLDAREIIFSFDKIIQDVFPSSLKQKRNLSKVIKNLSHELTDERSERRLGYMNETEKLSAYINYFSWWNIFQFVRLFSSLGESAFSFLNDDDVCVDIGSGPLTVVIALWLSFPMLRSKKLKWYCIDVSQKALSVGEDLYLSVASKTPPLEKTDFSHWHIVRVKGEIGVNVKEKAKFITSANMFNELIERNKNDVEDLAQKYIPLLFSYAKNDSRILVLEPGVPLHARIITLVREHCIKNGFEIISPCPHQKKCPMNGFRAKLGGKTKWCNFAFSTKDAPPALRKISESASLLKERAVVSFVCASKNTASVVAKNGAKIGSQNGVGDDDLPLRIVSEKIFLPQKKEGHYACSEMGLTLAVNESGKEFFSGDLILAKSPTSCNSLKKVNGLEKSESKKIERDGKTNAVIVKV